MKTILVTGAAGFIGAALVIRLIENGENVIGLDNLNSYYDTNLKESRLKKIYAVLDGWIRESIPEFINTVLSLAPGTERDEAKRVLRNRMDTLTDPNLKRTLYAVCRSLKILN